MSLARSLKVLVVMITVGILSSTIGVVGGKDITLNWTTDTIAVGSGSAGSGSLAVAAFFSTSTSTLATNGAGAFSGSLLAPSGGNLVDGVFSLNVGNPASAPVLPCPAGQVSASGSVTSGSFQGKQVLVASCIGTGVPGFYVVYDYLTTDVFFSGSGLGTAKVSSSPVVGGIAAAGVTSGSGTAGTGTVYTAEADAVTRDGSLIGGGAFVGTPSPVLRAGGTWQLSNAAVGPGCTLTTSGVTAPFGSFPNQPVSDTITPVSCPPTSLGTQSITVSLTIGTANNPLYAGHGTGLARVNNLANLE